MSGQWINLKEKRKSQIEIQKEENEILSNGSEEPIVNTNRRVSFQLLPENNRRRIPSQRSRRSGIASSLSLVNFIAGDLDDSDEDADNKFEMSLNDLEDWTKYERVRDWLTSLCRLDPRSQIKVFFDECAQAGVSNIEDKGMNVMDLSPILKFFSKAQVFTVWRPTSMEAIRKMMTGDAVGKGLGIKGKSAKVGLLSGYVPFLQIHSDDNDKKKIGTLPKDARIRVFFRTEKSRDAAVVELEKVSTEMIEIVDQAIITIEKEGEVPDEVYEEALTNMKLKMTEPEIILVDDNAPNAMGIDIPERLFWEAFVTRKDITRKEGSPMDTGRLSEPAFQHMNFATTRKPKKYDPKAVVFQYGGHADNDPLCPLTLLMAYEENGRVMPVASDFDGFLMGTKRTNYESPLPPAQIGSLRRTINQIEEVLDDESTRDNSWTTNWLNVLKKNTIDGVKPNMPQYGYGDPKTYCIMENAISRLQSNGAVRHGSECFNYFFPQELDEQFLVISGNFEGTVPWKYLNVTQLQQFLCDQIDQGFTFPLNPKWILCDLGWSAVYDKLRASKHPNVQSSLDSWLPPDSGLQEKIESIRQKHPLGFVRRRQEIGSKMKSNSGFEQEATYAMDLATLQLERYLALQRAKRKLRIILLFLRMSQPSGETTEEKESKLVRISEEDNITPGEGCQISAVIPSEPTSSVLAELAEVEIKDEEEKSKPMNSENNSDEKEN